MREYAAHEKVLISIRSVKVGKRAAVVAHLAEWSLPTPENLGSNPASSNFY